MDWRACLLPLLLLSSASLAATSEQRREELARVQELLADPDPLARIVNMESIIQGGDAVKIDIALRTAFSSNDQQLRGLALRAYLARNKTLQLDVTLPPVAVAELEQAEQNGRITSALRRQYAYVGAVQHAGNRVQLTVRSYGFPDDRGLLESNPPTPFSIAGDRFVATVRVFGRICSVEFAPTSRLTFVGTLGCDYSWPKLPLGSTIY